MTSQQLKKLKLPDSPGIYVFRDQNKRPLYIGRATSLKDRVKSYFSDDLMETRGPRIVDMITKAKIVSWSETGSVLEAVILESELIKKYQPFYNVDDRDDKSSNYVIITDESWPRVFLARARDLEANMINGEVLNSRGKVLYRVKKKFGPYPDSGSIKEALKILRKLFPFKDKMSHDPRHESFYKAIGRSPEDYDDNARLKYRNTIKYLILFFEGKKNVIKKKLEKDMRDYASNMRFEEADRAKKLIYALDHINDIALIKRRDEGQAIRKKMGSPTNDFMSSDFRMEAYDVAHLSGQNVVGVMVVSVNGKLAPDQYRKFKIYREKNDDIAGLMEIISRRMNHSEWPYPDLIVVDGNENHMRAAKAVLSARRINIPIVAVTKDKNHKAARIVGNSDTVNIQEMNIIALNAEAHRFAIKYHRQIRKLL